MKFTLRFPKKLPRITLRRAVQVVSIMILAGGLAIMAPLGYYWLHDKEAVAHASTVTIPTVSSVTGQSPLDKPGAVSGMPVEIKISDRLPLDLQVVPGYYDKSTGQWNLSLTQAQYATATIEPNNETGMTFIYGHYRPEVFAYLHWIQPGDKATLITSNGYAFTYTFERSEPFDPTNTSVFKNANTGAPRLTIQTCSGTFMQHRQMYYFKYDNYAKVK